MIKGADLKTLIHHLGDYFKTSSYVVNPFYRDWLQNQKQFFNKIYVFEKIIINNKLIPYL